MTGEVRFVKAMTDGAVSIREQVVGLVWRLSSEKGLATISEICEQLELAGHATQNQSRMKEQLAADKRVVKRNDGFAISARHEAEVLNDFGQFTNRKVVKEFDSVLPRELFDGTRAYIERVVAQINGSYDHAMHDCCAVMCRRLGETLIIEVYEAEGRSKDIKDANNNFFMLNGLLEVLKKDAKINLGRNSKKGLDDLKELGDKSAHNRRFNARQTDIDAIRVGLRTAAEELMHLAGLAK